MTLFLFSASALSLLFAAVMLSWYGQEGFFAIPLLVASLCGVVLGINRMRVMAKPFRRPTIPVHPAWSKELCRAMNSASLILRGPAVVFANRAFLDLVALPDRADEIIGLPFSNLLHPGDHERLAAHLGAATAESAGGGEVLLRLLRAGGEVIRVHTIFSPLDSDSGGILVQFQSDVTAVRVPEISSESVGAVIDQLDLVLFKVDIEGRLAWANRAWERLTGRTVADCRGRSMTAVFHPDDRDAVATGLAGLISGGADRLQLEVRMVHVAGKVSGVTVRAQPCAFPAGELHGAVGTLVEVSNRRRLDDLGSSRRYVNTLLANVPGMVYRGQNDPDWTMEFVSDGCFDLTGYEAWELVGDRQISFASLIHVEDRDFVWIQAQAAIAQRKPYRISYRIVDAAGQTVWVWEQGRGVFSAQGELIWIEGFITDMTARSSTEDRAHKRAWFDARNGMTSRAVFDALLDWTLHQAQLRSFRFAVLWVDVSLLRKHLAGLDESVIDAVIDQIARRFQPALNPGIAVTYLGDWCFGVLVTDFRSSQSTRLVSGARGVVSAVSRLSQHLATALSEPIQVGEVHVVPEVSIGIVTGEHKHTNAESLLAAARRGASQAAAIGPGRSEFAGD